MLLGVLMTFATGCTRRFKLTPTELARLERRAQNPEDVFVYPHRKVIVVYRLDTELEYQSGRTVKIDLERETLVEVLKRNKAGQIVGKGDQNGVPILWVSFRPSCEEPRCAFGFVRTEDNLYKLAVVPLREGYKPPTTYRRTETKRNKTKKRKVKTLAEANEVYTVKRGKRVKWVHLDVKKRIREREKRRIEVHEGR